MLFQVLFEIVWFRFVGFFHFPQETLVCVIRDSLHLSYLHFSISVIFKDPLTNTTFTILVPAFNSQQ